MTQADLSYDPPGPEPEVQVPGILVVQVGGEGPAPPDGQAVLVATDKDSHGAMFVPLIDKKKI